MYLDLEIIVKINAKKLPTNVSKYYNKLLI